MSEAYGTRSGRPIVEIAWTYQDDVNAGSETPKSHVQGMNEILTSKFKKGLRLNKLSKCRFEQSSVETLRFCVFHVSVVHLTNTTDPWPSSWIQPQDKSFSGSLVSCDSSAGTAATVRTMQRPCLSTWQPPAGTKRNCSGPRSYLCDKQG
jgi:hypothetical protein